MVFLANAKQEQHASTRSAHGKHTQQVTEQISQVRHSSQTLEDLQSSVTSEIRCCLPPSPKLQCWYATVVGALAKFLPATAEFTMKQAGATLDAGGEGGRVQGACDLAGQP